MADVKISGLPASTVPLAGTEVLPIVQGGSTKQVSIANVTAGRAVAALSVTTATVQAPSGSGGGTLNNGSGVSQLQWGSGGGSSLSLQVATNINPANAAVNISPTGTGTVAISPAGALTINPTVASTMNNVALGGSTAAAGTFTNATANAFIPNSATIPTNGTYLPAANTLGFATASTARGRFAASGEFLVACTALPVGARTLGFAAKNVSTGGIQIYQVASNTDWAINVTSGSIANFYSDNGTALVFAGSINVNGNVTTYGSISDYRLKEKIAPITGALAKVQQLNPVTYTFKNSGQTSQGFVAHELQEIVPECVVGKKDDIDSKGAPVYQGVDTSFLVATLVAAIKELNAKVIELEAQVINLGTR